MRLQSSNSLEKWLNPGDFQKSNGLIPPNIPPAIFEAFRRLFESLNFRFCSNLPAVRDGLTTFNSVAVMTGFRREADPVLYADKNKQRM